MAKKLAEKLGIPYYDKELLTLAAKESGICEEMFEDHDEKPTRSLLFSLVTGLQMRGDAGSGYVLTDGWGNLLKNAEDDEFIKEAEAGELSHDDLLISKLIAFSPNKIVLHGADQGAAIFKTLRQIFENRLEFRSI